MDELEAGLADLRERVDAIDAGFARWLELSTAPGAQREAPALPARRHLAVVR